MTHSTESALRCIDLTLIYPVCEYGADGSVTRSDLPASELLLLLQVGAVEAKGTQAKIRRFCRTCPPAEAQARIRTIQPESTDHATPLASPKTYFRETSESGCYKIFQHATARCKSFRGAINAVVARTDARPAHGCP